MLYTYEHCGVQQDEFRSVAERNNGPACPKCGEPMPKIIGGHKVIGDMDPYYDDNLETYVKSRQHRKQLMREKDVYEKIGKGWQ